MTFRKLALILVALTTALSLAQLPSNYSGWTHYGGDPGGMRYSAATQITRDNLAKLEPVWTFHTHTFDSPRPGTEDASFEDTPILIGDTLYVISPLDIVFALDARNGKQRWAYDAQLHELADGDLVTARGVSYWESPTPVAGQPCNRRIFFGTVDGRLIALDADSGRPCDSFSNHGTADLTQGVNYQHHGMYSVTSPPAIVGNMVVVGTAVGDNQRVSAESGLVRGYDVVTGKLVWGWEPLPWARTQNPVTGAGNAWSILAADPALGLVYVPTGSASPDYFGGLRLGDNRDADSVVALDAKTGRKVWAFQVVHHDLWDYDVASEPLLFTFHPGQPDETPAVAVTTKMGQVFVLDRRDGQPLYKVDERPVPQTDVPGEQTSLTQPFSSLPSLNPLTPPQTSFNEPWRTPADRDKCRSLLAGLRYEGIYTPVSIRGSLMYPGNLGGVNWGSAALDPATGTLYANNNRIPYSARLIPRASHYVFWHEQIRPIFVEWPNWLYAALSLLALMTILSSLRAIRKRPNTRLRDWLPGPVGAFVVAAMLVTAVLLWHLNLEQGFLAHFGHELSPMEQTPYLILRDRLVDDHNHPCLATPWGAMTALDLQTGKLSWQTALGSMVEGEPTGNISLGGPIVTASGLVFSAGTNDPHLRAFDAANGKQLWNYTLPNPAQATPMTYVLDGKQYLVIAAGGHVDQKDKRGDTLIAFSVAE